MSKVMQEFRIIHAQKVKDEQANTDVHLSDLYRAGCTTEEIRKAVQSGKLKWRRHDMTGYLYQPDSLENRKTNSV